MKENKINKISKLDLFDAGWFKDGDLWVSPYNGDLMNLEMARVEEARRQEENKLNPDI